MESHDHQDLIDELVTLMIGTYLHLVGLFAELPLTVELPEFQMDPDRPNSDEVLMALQRARALLNDEPMGDLHKQAYDRLAIQWFTIYELTALAIAAGPAPWRVDGVRSGVFQFGTMAEMIESGELDDLENGEG